MLSAAWIAKRSVSIRGWVVGERPILFSGEMVRAILDGRKTVTRRAIKLPRARDSFVLVEHGAGWWPYQSDDGESHVCSDGMERPYNCPYGSPGDQLWVRETCFINGPGKGSEVIYKADPLPNWEGEETDIRWRPSIHMPRWASRIQLEITAVRVERLHQISQKSALDEGCGVPDLPSDLTGLFGESPADERTAFAILWSRINGQGSWAANPWVWVVEFKVVEGAQ